jgi:hypothetical protein
MRLKIYRVFANTLDTDDPSRIVTTNRRRYAQHWWTLKVRAESDPSAWGFAKRMHYAPDVHHPGIIDGWCRNIKNQLEQVQAPYLMAQHVAQD